MMIINEIMILLIFFSIFGLLYKLYYNYHKSKFDNNDYNCYKIRLKKVKKIKNFNNKKVKKPNNIEICSICEKEFTKKKTSFKIIKPVCPSCIKNIVGKDIDEYNYKDKNYNKQKTVTWDLDQYYNYKLNN